MDLKMKESEKIELEKVEATEEEKSYWSGLLDQEAQAKEKLEVLEPAKTKITQLYEKTKEELGKAEEALTEKLLAWAMSGKNKGLNDLKEKITGFRDLICDCEKALPLIEGKIYPCFNHINRGRRIRTKIAERMKAQASKS